MKKPFNVMLISMLGVAAFAGCSTVRTACPLPDSIPGGCSTMQDVYAAAKSTEGRKMRGESVFMNTSAAGQQDPRPYFKGELSNYPDAGQEGMPVFKQPKVHRVWVAPYVDADGNLRSGEYAYFNTPGEWNYGTMKKSGEASGIFGPAKPGANLGFNPVQQPAKVTTTPATPSGQPPMPGKQSNTTVNGVTQPQMRLAQ